MKVRCPKCSWEPDGNAYWQCHCGHQWNTFETAARCPACGFQHEKTSCVPFAGGCHAHSDHLDWYEGLDDIIEELKQEVFSEEFADWFT